MLQGKWKNSNGWSKGFLWLAIMLLLTLIVMVIWTVLPINHQAIGSLKWFQFVQTLATFFVPPLIVAWLCSDNPKRWLQIDTAPKWWMFVGAILVMIMALPGINLLADWNSRMSLPDWLKPLEDLMRQQEEAAQALTERFLQGKGIGMLLINVGLLALLPAAEELTFRGMLQKLIPNKHVAIWVVAIIFSAIHFQFYGFVPRMLLGAMFGYMLVWTGSLWIPMTMHFVNNAVTVVAYWVIYNNNLNPNSVETFGTGETLWLGIVSLVLTGVGLYFCWRLSRTMSKASSRIS
ncbi:MAG: CPBP family intramembrane metalloprotease [Paludibacteraceae bacterium]|nr:CPBP family intramembrane metalloprotease [Paludibacteraceae bacterium]